MQQQLLLSKLQKRLTDVQFAPGEAFSWSPATSTVNYRLSDTPRDSWALLHEAAHALLGHTGYVLDLDLVLMEVAAWEHARQLAEELGLNIDDDHIQDSLDTYRDWLHQRSTCPRCSTVSLQHSPHEYRCHNCNASWHVSASRFCRPYRLSIKPNKRSPGIVSQATFH